VSQVRETPTAGGEPPSQACKIALLWRGDPAAAPPAPESTRQAPIFKAVAERGALAEPVIYADHAVDAVRERLMSFDGVLVWVDPISDGADRSTLDPMLREVAARGVWVSAHPDVILKMGVKEVLYRTRRLGWGADTHLYAGARDLHDRFPERLAAAGPRVLKQNRGNGGIGVWKVEEIVDARAPPGSNPRVRVLQARRGAAPEDVSLGDFLGRCEVYFEDGGRIIDQAFQPRLPEGMIRCYMTGDEVVGFGHQLIKALIPPPPAGADPEAALPGPRIMHPPSAPPFQALREAMESEWVPAMQGILDIETADLPALWDADFLYGPRTAAGEDSYVLCEINVSAVAPFPESAAPKVALAAMTAARAAMKAR
jgi:hypothetical protein